MNDESLCGEVGAIRRHKEWPHVPEIYGPPCPLPKGHKPPHKVSVESRFGVLDYEWEGTSE